jgi:hypothetical protein
VNLRSNKRNPIRLTSEPTRKGRFGGVTIDLSDSMFQITRKPKDYRVTCANI